jgi:hypothetical protein
MMKTTIFDISVTVVNYNTRKRLIRSNFKYNDNYRDTSTGKYLTANWNRPLLHKFTEKEIKILNYHDSKIFGAKRIINQVNVIERNLIASRETGIDLDFSEKIERPTRIEDTDLYLFLRFKGQHSVEMFIYDYERD